jgi:chitin disaccharide deacetylase
MRSERGLLIVNADDWGYDEAVTRAIADCHAAGGLTSTTAMSFMEGAKLGAELSREHPKLGIGLHLNLIEPYTDPGVPAAVRERQKRMVDRFQSARLRRWIYDPFLRREVSEVIRDQIGAYVDLYGQMPTHFDGHHHSHMAANVLFSRALPSGAAIRNALSDTGEGSAVRSGLRAVRQRAIASRFETTDYFFSIETLWPRLEGTISHKELDLSRSASVEIMVHPGFPHEYAPLQSQPWVDCLKDYPTGTFRDLA